MEQTSDVPRTAAGETAGRGAAFPVGSSLAVFAAALIVRLAYALEMRGHPLFAHPLGDAAAFDGWARGIAGGDLLGSGAFPLAPLYPYLLGGVYAVFGAEPFTARLVQAVLGALTALALSHATFRTFGRGPGTARAAGLFAGLAFAFFAPAVHYGALLGKSALASLLLACTLLLVSDGLDRIRPRRAALVGLCVGALYLTRENAAVVALPIAAWFAARSASGDSRGSARLRRVGGFALGVALALLPAVARNVAVGTSALPGAGNAGVNLFIGNNESADGLYAPLVAGRGSARFEAVDAKALAERAEGRELDAAGVSGHWAGRALDWASSNPGAAFALFGRKVRFTLSDVEWMDTTSYAVHREESRVLGVFGILGRFGWLLPLGLAGLVLAWGDRRTMPVPPGQIGLWAALLTLSIAAFFVFGRFRVSVAVALVPFAGRALAALRGGGARAWPAVALAFAVGLGLAWWPPPEGLERPVVDTYNSLGVAQRDAGELEAARATFSRAALASPDAGSAAFNLGLVELQLGDIAGAEVAFDQASARAPAFAAEANLELAEALMTRGDRQGAALRLARATRAGPKSAVEFMRAGRLARQLGQPRVAETCYRRSLELDPASAETHNNLGYLLQTEERFAEAAASYTEAVVRQPDFVRALVNLAWLRVGAPDPAVRDLAAAQKLSARVTALLGANDRDALRLAEAVRSASR